MSASTILAAIAAVLIGAVTAFNSWQTRRSLARFKANNDQLRAELEAATAARDAAQLQEAATARHADRQAAGHVAAGEIPDATTGRPDADRAALYDGMRTAADRRRAGAGAGGDAAVRPVPGPDATGGDGRGD